MGGSNSGSSSGSSGGKGATGASGHGGMVSGSSGSSHTGTATGPHGGHTGNFGSTQSNSFGMIGGLNSGDRARSGLTSSGGGGGNTVSPITQGQPYGLGMSPDAFWDAYEKRYGVPVTQSQQMKEAQAQADKSVAGFQKLTDDLLGRFEQSWGEVFGGQTGGVERGSLFPELGYEGREALYTVPEEPVPTEAPAPTQEPAYLDVSDVIRNKLIKKGIMPTGRR